VTWQKRKVVEKIIGQLEASFLIFLTLGSITQSNTMEIEFVSVTIQVTKKERKTEAKGRL